VQELAFTRVEYTHRKGESAMIVHLDGRADDAGIGLYREGTTCAGDYTMKVRREMEQRRASSGTGEAF
jgi:hypothetical protein